MKYKNDIVLLVVLACLCMIPFWGQCSLRGQEAGTLEIVYKGDLIETVSLNISQYILVVTENDSCRLFFFHSYEELAKDLSAYSEYNVVSMQDGMVSVKEATCKGQDCVRQNAISKEKQTIICLPHKLVLSVKANALAEEDAVTW